MVLLKPPLVCASPWNIKGNETEWKSLAGGNESPAPKVAALDNDEDQLQGFFLGTIQEVG